MNESASPDVSTLDLDSRVDRLCDQFESAWRNVSRPSIEEFLSRVEEPARSVLLTELLQLEPALRREDHRSLTAENYLWRFPAQAELIESVFAGSRRTDGALSGETRFRVLRRLAGGGLGEIYVAQDQELNREVALKESKSDRAHTPQRQARFLFEAEITGRLEHPGIVPVYSLNYHSDGRPYYAMRLIRGETLDEKIKQFHAANAKADRHASAKALELRGLLNHFIDVCDAIEYAHSRGILHRDIKPRNIMVGPYGETVVVDWGLAKVMGETDSASDSSEELLCPSRTADHDPTQLDSRLGTPRYMSPEQAAGKGSNVGPRSDVYGLGATLYHLLTDRAPFDGDDGSQILSQVRRGELPRPRQVRPDVPRSLEAICQKAMALDPGDRYSSPRKLADDLNHWLADEPVSAWIEPWSAKASRFLTRHRTLVAISGVLVPVVFVALTFFTLTQRNTNQRLAALNRELTQANEAAERARGRADDRVALALRAIEHFHRSVSDNVDVKNRPELEPLRRALLQAPFQFYLDLEKDLRNSAETRPETLLQFTAALAGLGEITSQLGGEADADRAYRQAIDVLSVLHRDHPAAAEYANLLAKAYANLAILQTRVNRPEQAMDSATRALDLYRRLMEDHPADRSYPLGLADAEHKLAEMKRWKQPAEALVLYRHGLGLLEQLVRAQPDEQTYRFRLALALSALGVFLREVKQTDEALAVYQRARATFQALLRENPSAVNYRAGLAQVCYNIGNLYGIDRHNRDLAMKHYHEARAIRAEIVKEHPSFAEHRADLARTYGQMGTFLGIAGQRIESLANLEEARKLLVGLAGDHPEVIRYRVDLAITWNQIGGVNWALGRVAEALQNVEAARDSFEQLVRDAPEDMLMRSRLGEIWHRLGDSLENADRPADREQAYRQAIARQREAYEGAAPSTQLKLHTMNSLLGHYDKLATVQEITNRREEAIESLVRCHEIQQDAHDPGAEELYHDAQRCSRVCGLIDMNVGNITPAEQARRREFFECALASLRRSIARDRQRFRLIAADRAFDPLRSASEFRSLLMDLEFPQKRLAP
jgi:serine/threonine-protein kinase